MLFWCFYRPLNIYTYRHIKPALKFNIFSLILFESVYLKRIYDIVYNVHYSRLSN